MFPFLLLYLHLGGEIFHEYGFGREFLPGKKGRKKKMPLASLATTAGQVFFFELFIFQKASGITGHYDPPIFQNVGPIGIFECDESILLNHNDGRPVLFIYRLNYFLASSSPETRRARPSEQTGKKNVMRSDNFRRMAFVLVTYMERACAEVCVYMGLMTASPTWRISEGRES